MTPEFPHDFADDCGILEAVALHAPMECSMLRQRPVGINVKIKTAIEEDVEREKLVPVTPMDRAGWN
jgi:hypothetical protein